MIEVLALDIDPIDPPYFQNSVRVTLMGRGVGV